MCAHSVPMRVGATSYRPLAGCRCAPFVYPALTHECLLTYPQHQMSHLRHLQLGPIFETAGASCIIVMFSSCTLLQVSMSIETHRNAWVLTDIGCMNMSGVSARCHLHAQHTNILHQRCWAPTVHLPDATVHHQPLSFTQCWYV